MIIAGAVLHTVGAVLLIGITATSHAMTTESWNFTVYLDDSEIGTHRFEVTETGQRKIVEIRADFTVKLLFFTAYAYEHANREVWDDGCLRKLRSSTNDNGERFRVRGELSGQQFVVETGGDRKVLPPCVRSFSYWDPRFLDTGQLLNAQNGEYIEVDVEKLGRDKIRVRDRMLDADHWRLVTEDAVIDLWYSPQREWLALESTTGNGSRLRYRIE